MIRIDPVTRTQTRVSSGGNFGNPQGIALEPDGDILIAEFNNFSNAGGVEPWITTPEEFAAEMRSEFATYGKLVREVGAKID